MAMRAFLASCVLFVLSGGATLSGERAPAGAFLQPDYAAIRGANYVASYASTSVGFWKDYSPNIPSIHNYRTILSNFPLKFYHG